MFVCSKQELKRLKTPLFYSLINKGLITFIKFLIKDRYQTKTSKLAICCFPQLFMYWKNMLPDP